MTKPAFAAQMEHNRQLALLFHQMANCYRYLGAGEKFRAIAYTTAAQTLERLDEPVDSYADSIQHLDQLPGVGESIAAKIEEYLETGKIATLEKLKQTVPFALLELMEVGGIGPATLRLLHDKAGINSREDLIKAIQGNALKGLRGLGQKKIDHMRQVLKLPEAKQRMPWDTAHRIGSEMLQQIENLAGVKQAALAGSLRRHKETVGDIDIVAAVSPLFQKRIMRKIISLPPVQRVLAAGSTKASLLLKDNGVQVDVRLVHSDEYGAALFYFTGSKEHNIAMRTLAKQHGWKINEYGVFDAKGKRLAGATEEEIYRLFHMKFIPPEKRVGGTEIEQALA